MKYKHHHPVKKGKNKHKSQGNITTEELRSYIPIEYVTKSVEVPTGLQAGDDFQGMPLFAFEATHDDLAIIRFLIPLWLSGSFEGYTPEAKRERILQVKRLEAFVEPFFKDGAPSHNILVTKNDILLILSGIKALKEVASSNSQDFLTKARDLWDRGMAAIA